MRLEDFDNQCNPEWSLWEAFRPEREAHRAFVRAGFLLHEKETKAEPPGELVYLCPHIRPGVNFGADRLMTVTTLEDVNGVSCLACKGKLTRAYREIREGRV